MSSPITDVHSFNKHLKSTSRPVLVDFYSPSCGPCKMISSTLDQIASEQQDTLSVIKIDITDLPDIAIQYKVKSVPMLILFEQGVVSRTKLGYATKKDIEKFIEG